VSWVEAVVLTDRWVSTGGAAFAFGCSCGSAYSAVHFRMHLWTVCARLFPREPASDHKISKLVLLWNISSL
jgi:hypothetical protein